ncbi:MAG: hypothetical protein ACRDTJ_23115, partial [Pseudonocardiaceae bacterium]
MTTHIKDERQITDLRDGRGSRPLRNAVKPTTQPAQDSMGDLVRQGLDTSLRSVQVWSDLARQVNLSGLGAAAGATMAALAHEPFEELLVAQREIVGELVATQRQLTQQVFYTTAT